MSIIRFPRKAQPENERLLLLAQGAIAKAQDFSCSGQTRAQHLSRMIAGIKQGKRD